MTMQEPEEAAVVPDEDIELVEPEGDEEDVELEPVDAEEAGGLATDTASEVE